MGGSPSRLSTIAGNRHVIGVQFSDRTHKANLSALERIGRDLIRKFGFYAVTCPQGGEQPQVTGTSPRRAPSATTTVPTIRDPNWEGTNKSNRQKSGTVVPEGQHTGVLGQSDPGHHTEPSTSGSSERRALFRSGKDNFNRKNYTAAAPDLLAAAERGHVKAMGYVGYMYENGLELSKDSKAAFRWYRKGAEGGDAYSAANLGRCYRYGRGVGRNMPAAIRWFRYATEQGERTAPYNLASMYEIGTDPLPQDYREALRLYKLSAERGYAKGMRMVGWYYQDGRGTDTDEIEALRWYRKAAERGSAEAYNDLGVFYQEGRGGLQQDANEGLRWYQMSAKRGIVPAMHNLARAYELGLGTPRNKEKAIYWYRKASERGHEGAQKRLKVLENK
jgi:TPR repeat protein